MKYLSLPRHFLLMLLCCIGTITLPLHVFAESGYVGDEFDLDQPNVPYNATKIRKVTWSGQRSEGISCYETSRGLHVKITSFFEGSKHISCQIEYEWISGDRTLTSHVNKTYFVNCKTVEINVINDEMTLKVGQTQAISYELSPSKNAKLTFKSNNTSVATVSNTGEVKAVGTGTARITIEQNMGFGAICNVTVTDPVAATSISLPATAEVYAYSSIILHPTLQPAEANPTLTWECASTSIASVDQNGKVTGNQPGTAIVTVTTDNGLSASCTVTVKDVDRTPQTFDIADEYAQKTVYVGDTWLTPYTVTPSYADYTLLWTSSDESVATVSYGLVKALRQGKAKITARIDGTELMDECDVIVKGIPNVLTIWFVNGQRTDIKLSENINMTFEDDKFLVKGTTIEVEYEAIDVRKFTLESDESEETDIQTMKTSATAGVMNYDDNAILLSGFTPNSTVQLFFLNGQLGGTYRMGQDGSLTIPIDGLSRGVHIVKTESITYKIIKK